MCLTLQPGGLDNSQCVPGRLYFLVTWFLSHPSSRVTPKNDCSHILMFSIGTRHAVSPWFHWAFWTSRVPRAMWGCDSFNYLNNLSLSPKAAKSLEKIAEGCEEFYVSFPNSKKYIHQSIFLDLETNGPWHWRSLMHKIQCNLPPTKENSLYSHGFVFTFWHAWSSSKNNSLLLLSELISIFFSARPE